MVTPPCPISARAGPSAASLSHAAHASSAYSASLPPTYRLSAFPVSPSDCSPRPGHSPRSSAAAGDTTAADPPRAPSPGRPTHTVRGFDCPASTTTRDDGDTGSASAGSGSSSRKSSAGSACTDETDADGNGAATPLSSLAGSTLSECGGGSMAAASNLARTSPAVAGIEWGVGGLAIMPAVPKDDAAKREREARARRGGWEDPALAAARRALWDDVPAEEVEHGAGAGGEEQGTVEVFVEDDAGEEGATGSDDGDSDDEWGLPPVGRPCHTTLTPRSSCLRYSPAARTSLSLPHTYTSSSSPDEDRPHDSTASGRHSPSAASTSSTSAPSVSFSCAPPQTCATWSAEAYSRRGDAPVEKLSIREWIELQGVREAVGVWSGKIAKWDEVLAADAAGPAPGADPCLTARGRTPYPLAAVVGVVHVSRSTPSSPVDASRLLALP